MTSISFTKEYDILVAGQAWEVMRVNQAALLTGQVAGLAAAEAIERDTTPERSDAAEKSLDAMLAAHAPFLPQFA